MSRFAQNLGKFENHRKPEVLNPTQDHQPWSDELRKPSEKRGYGRIEIRGPRIQLPLSSRGTPTRANPILVPQWQNLANALIIGPSGKGKFPC